MKFWFGKKRFLALIMVTMVFFSACGSSNSNGSSSGTKSDSTDGEAITLIAAHSLDTTHPVHQGFVKMDEVLQEISGGTMNMTIYPSSSLGDEEPVLETQAIGGGTIDLSAPSGAALQTFSPEFLTTDFPFVFSSYDQVWKFYDGEFGEYLYSTLEGTGLIGLAWWDNGFRNLTTSSKEIHTAEDVKGMKIRTMSARVHMATWNAMGAAATPIPFGELYSALQQKVVDGQENPIANILGNKFNEVQEYIILTRHVHDPSPLIVSEDSWKNLTSQQQEWLKQAADEAAIYMRQVSEDEESMKLEQLIEYGNKIIELTDEELQTFVDSTKDVYKGFENEITTEGLQLYFECVEKAKQ